MTVKKATDGSQKKQKPKKWFKCCGTICKKKKNKNRKKKQNLEGGEPETSDVYRSLMPDNFAIYAGVTSMSSFEV